MLKRKETEYTETVIDFNRYYSTSIFLSKNRKEYYITDHSVILANGDMVKTSSVDECSTFYGFPVKVYDKKSARLLGTKIVTTKELEFSKKFHTYYIDPNFNRLFSVSHSNPHTYKKGMDYLNDYSFSVLNSVTHSFTNEIRVNSIIKESILPESKDINKDIERIYKRKLSYFRIKGKYVAALHPQYHVPLIYFKERIVGYIDPAKKLKIFSNGPLAERLNETYGIR